MGTAYHYYDCQLSANLDVVTMRIAALLVLLIGLVGCTSAPVQEMSDARQALQAAETAGAVTHSAEAYQQARRFLRQAQQHLETGDYRHARRNAVTAKEVALEARREALAAQPLR